MKHGKVKLNLLKGSYPCNLRAKSRPERKDHGLVKTSTIRRSSISPEEVRNLRQFHSKNLAQNMTSKLGIREQYGPLLSKAF